jgi:chemotaxis signal transduction protein
MMAMRRGRARAFLGLAVAGIRYAIPIECVREVCKPFPVLAVPNRPPHALGMIHYRSKVIYAFSLRSKFGLEEQRGAREYFVVLEFSDTALALVADEVHGVFRAAREDDLPTPGLDQDSILFAMRRGNDLVFALDVEPFGRAIDGFELAPNSNS